MQRMQHEGTRSIKAVHPPLGEVGRFHFDERPPATLSVNPRPVCVNVKRSLYELVAAVTRALSNAGVEEIFTLTRGRKGDDTRDSIRRREYLRSLLPKYPPMKLWSSSPPLSLRYPRMPSNFMGFGVHALRGRNRISGQVQHNSPVILDFPGKLTIPDLPSALLSDKRKARISSRRGRIHCISSYSFLRGC